MRPYFVLFAIHWSCSEGGRDADWDNLHPFEKYETGDPTVQLIHACAKWGQYSECEADNGLGCGLGTRNRQGQCMGSDGSPATIVRCGGSCVQLKQCILPVRPATPPRLFCSPLCAIALVIVRCRLVRQRRCNPRRCGCRRRRGLVDQRHRGQPGRIRRRLSQRMPLQCPPEVNTQRRLRPKSKCKA